MEVQSNIENITGSNRYLNREFSWLMFNKRVLEEAANEANPVLERLKFLAIFENNLDEFYMVRVSGLIEQFESGVLDTPPDGLTPNEQLMLISETAFPLRGRAGKLYSEQISAELRKNGIYVRSYNELTEKQANELKEIYKRDIFPLCTPLIMRPAPRFPFISNRSLNLVVELRDEAGEIRLARVKIPSQTPRAIRIPRKKNEFILVEDLISAHLDLLFPGTEIVGSHMFRVLRDADIEIRELEAADLITSVEKTLRLRRFGDPVLIEVASTMPEDIRDYLAGELKLDDSDVLVTDGLLGMEVFWEIAAVDKPGLRFPPHVPYTAEVLNQSDSLFDLVRRRDVMIHHPYDSFRPVETFVNSVVKDDHVVGIKQTLYRVGKESPIVESLQEAAAIDKQVAAMVELKARFDESNNLIWSRELEQSGVHVTYGFADMKTHCKLCQVVRREGNVIRTYSHIGTGNYNPATARIYSDLGLFTSDPEINQDVAELFNYLTGFSRQKTYRKLLVAPLNVREGILERIKAEIESHRLNGNGQIMFKLNALVDPEVIEALYEASQAGVPCHLIVRGVCCLRPGVPGMSENIRVVSIVGRFLEHSRIYYFANNGQPIAYIGSADMMRRNLDRRIEVLVPVEDRRLVSQLENVFDCYLKDNVKSWLLRHDGGYVRYENSEPRFSAQEHFMSKPPSKGISLDE